MEEAKLRHNQAKVTETSAKLLIEEKLEFTRRLIIWENLGLLSWVFLAFLGVFFFNQIYSWLYLDFETLLIYIILRRLGCSSCYRRTTCTNGFGRLAGIFFGRGFVKKESVGNRLGSIVFAYFLLLVVPASVLFSILLRSVSYLSMLVLVCLLIVAFCSITTCYTRLTVNH